eukprot:6200433-Pleurochrysis_carterae.AAC.2
MMPRRGMRTEHRGSKSGVCCVFRSDACSCCNQFATIMFLFEWRAPRMAAALYLDACEDAPRFVVGRALPLALLCHAALTAPE